MIMFGSWVQPNTVEYPVVQWGSAVSLLLLWDDFKQAKLAIKCEELILSLCSPIEKNKLA